MIRTTNGVADTRGRGYRKVREGLVVSDKMDKTVIVWWRTGSSTPSTARSSAARGSTRRTTGERCGVGDRVVLIETRPLSATKRWRVAQILEKAK